MDREIAKLIENYVDEIKKAGMLETKPVERAFRKVERHRLLEWVYLPEEEGGLEYTGTKLTKKKFGPQDPELLKIIYSDQALLTRLDPPSSTSQPTLVANMLELLALEQGMNVLEIGAGTGYNAALMQEIVGKTGSITTIDIQEDVVEQTERLLKAAGYDKIEVLAKDGARGHPENAPYDRIIATVGCSDLSFRWAEQLADEGFMLIPLQHGGEGMDPLTKIWREDDKLSGRFVGVSGFMSIRGEMEVEQRTGFAKQRSLCSKEPTAEYPLFRSLEELNELRKKRCDWDKFSSLSLFMAIVDERACWYSLYGEKGGVAIKFKEDRIALYGEESLYQDLKSLCKHWEEMGKPGLSDWQLEFFPRNRAREIPEGEMAWTIERKFSTEIAVLKSRHASRDRKIDPVQ